MIDINDLEALEEIESFYRVSISGKSKYFCLSKDPNKSPKSVNEYTELRPVPRNCTKLLCTRSCMRR